MQKTLFSPLLGILLLGSACQSSDSKTTVQEPAATVAAAASPASAAAPSSAAVAQLQADIASPQVGDVYVVRFQPQGTADTRYFFYHLYRVTPDSAYLHPARKEATDPTADLAQPDFQASATSIGYSRAELAGLLQPQTGDALKTQLVQVRRMRSEK